MHKFCSKPVFYIGSLLACAMLAFTTGCASGGYKLTRQYARWVNSQNIIIRIIIYLLTSVVFAVTLLIDAVIFNTIDFWEGKVSGGKFEFKEGEKIYQVHHEIIPGSGLKRSTINVTNADQVLVQQIVMNETANGEIELLIDGKVRSHVRNITSIPVATIFDQSGQKTEEKVLLFDATVFTKQLLARF